MLPGASGVAWSAGASYETHHHIGGAVTRALSGYSAGAAGSCIYRGRVAEESRAYLPGCPERVGGTPAGGFSDPVVVAGWYRQTSILSGPAGPGAAGFWHAMAGLVSTKGVIYLFEETLSPA